MLCAFQKKSNKQAMSDFEFKSLWYFINKNAIQEQFIIWQLQERRNMAKLHAVQQTHTPSLPQNLYQTKPPGFRV